MPTIVFYMKSRYFVLNPAEGTLIKYKKSENYPFKPKFNKIEI